jgi:integrase
VPKADLTSKFVQRAICAPGARKTNFFDASIPGFLLEVRQSGGKTFYQRYRNARGRECQFKIGSPDVLSLPQARKKARNVIAQALLGDDPQQRRQELRAIPSFSEFVRDLYLPFAMNAKRSWRTDETVLRIQVLPAFGRLPLDQITTAMIADLLTRMARKGYASGTMNRVLVLLRFMFNLANKWKVPGALSNPTAGLKLLPEKMLNRFLSANEAQRLLNALELDANRTAARAIKLLLLTGARRNEITHARWDHVCWANRTLHVPCAKSGRPRSIVLNAAAVDLLRSIQPLPGNPYVFPSAITGRPSPTLHFPWTRIRKRAGLTDVRLHDLRHSFASFLVNKGVSIYVVQGLLGHTLVRTTQRYAHLADETLSQAAEMIVTIIQPISQGTLFELEAPS